MQGNSNFKEKDHHATISDLFLCTNYTIDVAAVSFSGLVGPGVQKDAATEETEPLPPTAVVAESAPENSALVSWDPATLCVDHFHVCYHDEQVPIDTCLDVWNNTVTLVDLLSCSKYTVLVTSVSPYGIFSNESYDNFRTPDQKPGEPENFSILEETPHTVDFTYDPPSLNPQCAVEYDFQEINLDQGSDKTVSSVPQPHIEGIFKNLDACTNYELRIRAVSVTKLHSEWVSKAVLTLEDTPSEPRNFTSSQDGTNNLDLQWWRPEFNSMCASRYILEWSGDTGDTGTETINPPSPDEPLPFEVKYTLGGLADCSSYTLTVHAITLSGTMGVDATTTGHTNNC
ncbi:unnamed protein product [Meganyctiphanes norvegica]|uniref:Fibronectin type-III domain-containing protein n=1 Tax=Meganyctiphanes norvegica TaxID=48144 RepID=A0AAV2S549_MEGNR